MTSHNPLAFVGGCPRSGTTLLGRIVATHPSITLAQHGQRLLARMRGPGVDADGNVTASIAGEPRLGVMTREAYEAYVREALRDGPIPFHRFVTEMLDRYAEVTGTEHVAYKLVTTHLPTERSPVEGLHELWPDARFLHIVRDGRDVFCSLRSWEKVDRLRSELPSFDEDPACTAAAWWDAQVRSFRDPGRALGDALYHEIRYERFVEDPKTECAQLCRFLGVPYDDAMPRYHEARPADVRGRGRKRAWSPIRSGLRSWRTQADPEEIERFEATAGGLLEELGYERRFPDPGPAARRAAQRIRSALAL